MDFGLTPSSLFTQDGQQVQVQGEQSSIQQKQGLGAGLQQAAVNHQSSSSQAAVKQHSAISYQQGPSFLNMDTQQIHQLGPSSSQQKHAGFNHSDTVRYQQGCSPITPQSSPHLTRQDEEFDFPPMSEVLEYMNMYD